jgi:hypothetical protein
MKYRSLLIIGLSLCLMGAGCRSKAAGPTDPHLIKASGPSVYYLGSDNRRYVFPTDRVYFSWYTDFSGVQTISDRQLSSYPIGGNVTYRPGTRLIKITTDPKVYAVSHNGILRWIKTEEVANVLFGEKWAQHVDDVADTFFINYQPGPSVEIADDYSIQDEQQRSTTIDADKELVAATAPSTPPTTPPSTTPPATVPPTTGATKTIRVYIAGESIERRNRYTAAPFTATGALNNPSNNDNEQYGWSVPLADRLKLRQPNLRIEFVGTDTWLSSDDYPFLIYPKQF